MHSVPFIHLFYADKSFSRQHWGHYPIIFARAEWIDKVNSKMIYERKPSSLVLYVLPITHIFGKLPLVPIGDTGTFPHRMRRESAEIPGASCESEPDKGDGCRW